MTITSAPQASAAIADIANSPQLARRHIASFNEVVDWCRNQAEVPVSLWKQIEAVRPRVELMSMSIISRFDFKAGLANYRKKLNLSEESEASLKARAYRLQAASRRIQTALKSIDYPRGWIIENAALLSDESRILCFRFYSDERRSTTLKGRVHSADHAQARSAATAAKAALVQKTSINARAQGELRLANASKTMTEDEKLEKVSKASKAKSDVDSMKSEELDKRMRASQIRDGQSLSGLEPQDEKLLAKAVAHMEGSLKDYSPFVSTAVELEKLVEATNKVSQSIVRSAHNLVPPPEDKKAEYLEFPARMKNYERASTIGLFALPRDKTVTPEIIKSYMDEGADVSLIMSVGEHLYYGADGIEAHLVARMPNPF